MLVEFALVLPLLLFLIFGFLQFGLAMNAKIDSTHLTAEGARYIVVNQNPGLKASPATTMADYIRSGADTLKLRAARVCISYPPNPETNTSGKVGDPVRVVLDQVSYLPFIGDLPWFGKKLKLATLPVTSEATMRLEAVSVPPKIPAGCTS